MWSVNGRLEGQNKEQSERAGQGTGGGGMGGTVSQPICSSSLIPKRKGRGRGEEREEGESDTTPAILFLSSAATAFVAMTTQADDLIAVAFECCSLKEPVTQDRGRQTAHRRGPTVIWSENNPASLLRH